MDIDVQRQLLAEENVLWQCSPYPGFILSFIEIYNTLFGLVVCGMAVHWNLVMWGGDDSSALKLLGVPFFVSGIYLLIGRFWVEKWHRQRFNYLVTNRRILILKDGIISKSLDIKRLPKLKLYNQSNGRGTIIFGDPIDQLYKLSPLFDTRPQLSQIDKANFVYSLILKQTRSPSVV